MKYILLCGGKGKRLEGLDLPKPLCLVRGKSILYHTLDSLPKEIVDITIIYTNHLNKYQFKNTVIHSCHELKKNFQFVEIDFDTRGPVETVIAGLSKTTINLDEQILLIDNDTINSFDLSVIDQTVLSIGTAKTQNTTKPYSFVKCKDNSVTDIKEKVCISDTYCTGLYYFPSINLFKELAKNVFEINSEKKEYFISDLYTQALKQNLPIKAFSCLKSLSLGTRLDIIENINKITNYPMRICFDIDNTLLTYSEKVGTSAGITAIPEMVELIQKLYSQGHTIILNTARGMKSSQSNIGLAGKNSYMNVFNQLNEMNIPYHEIYFAKPWADLYIDDKAWNHFTNPQFSEFFFNQCLETKKLFLPKNCSNNENVLYRNEENLIKEGPTSSLEGEAYFYQKARGTAFEGLLPTFIGSNITGSRMTIEMRFVDGVPVSRLFRSHLLNKYVLKKVSGALEQLHTSSIDDLPITKADLLSNYTIRLEGRVKNHPNYKLPMINEVFQILRTHIEAYVETLDYSLAQVIHGDPWFDNIIYSAGGEIKLLDMKGKIGDKFTLRGDCMTDWAKLYQSILGFDFYLNNEVYDPAYEAECRIWLTELLPFPLNDPVFEAVTACCILKTFYYFSKTEPILPIYMSLGKLNLFSFLAK
jgi:capsule biosynthesis phosphatase